MHPSIAKLPTQEAAALAFAEVEAAMRMLYQRGGQTALTELVGAMGHGFSDREAVAQAYGKSFPQFEADWRKDVAKVRPRGLLSPRAAAKKLVFKEDAKGAAAAREKDSSRPSINEASEIVDAEAKKSYRLGEILLARRRWAAAAAEYGKARAKVKDLVPCLQIKKVDEALSALVGATATDPTDEAAQSLLARVYVLRGEWQKARAALDAGIAVDPFDPELHATYLSVARGLNDPALEKREQRMLALAVGRALNEDKTP